MENTGNTTPIRKGKGFRQKPLPTKGQVLEENQTLAQDLQDKFNGLQAGSNFMSNMLQQLIAAFKQLGPEVDALTTLEASSIMHADTEIVKGDHVMMDYVGVVLNEDGTTELDEDGLPKHMTSMYGLKFTLRNLGSGSLIAGFEDSLVGKRSSDNYEFNCTFPADYPAKELQNRKAKFSVYIHRVYRPLVVSSVEATVADYVKAKNAAMVAKNEAARALQVAKDNTARTVEASTTEVTDTNGTSTSTAETFQVVE